MLFRFSGHGVDERTLIAVLGKSHPEKRKSFRKANPHFFKEDERSFERWDDHRIKLLKQEFMRFKVFEFFACAVACMHLLHLIGRRPRVPLLFLLKSSLASTAMRFNCLN